MKIKPRVLLSLLLSVVVVFTAVAKTPQINNENNKKIGIVLKGQSGEYITVSQKGKYVFSVEPNTAALRVKTIDGTEIWNSAVSDKIYSDFSSSSDAWKNYMQSLVKIVYAEKKNMRDNIIEGYSADPSNEQTVTAYDDGFRADINFASAGIKMSVEVTFNEDGVSVTIPFSSVSETGEYCLRTVEVFPFFGASDSNKDGYIFYPDGNGALSCFDKTDDKHLYTQAISLPVYSSYVLEDLLTENKTAAMLPVYGIKCNNNAFLATVTAGDTAVSINVNTDVGNAAVHLNYAAFSFAYRDTYRVYMSNITSNGRNTAQNLYGSMADGEMLSGERSIRIFFLEGERANYSGMANCYREYLIKKGILKENFRDSATLQLTLLMSAKEKSGFIKKTVAATTFKEAEKIIGDYRENGIEKLDVLLRGWSKNGYSLNKVNFKPEKNSGGKKGLLRLNKKATEIGNTNIFLENNMMITSSKGEAVYAGSSVPVANLDETKYLRSSKSIVSLIGKNFKNADKYGVGVAFGGIGSMLYRNYRSNAIASRDKAVKDFSNAVNKSKKPLAIEGGNLYMLKNAERIYGISNDNSLDILTDYAVPFYSMVVHGSVQLTGMMGNRASDFRKCMLKWIEYGFDPSFELTYQNPNVLKYTEYATLFSSENAEWKSVVCDTYKIFNEELKFTSSAYMVSHTIYKNGLVSVGYSDGHMIYINYNNEKCSVNGIAIEPESYLVKEVK